MSNVFKLQRGNAKVLCNVGRYHDGIIVIVDGDNRRPMLWHGRQGETERETIERAHRALEALSPFNPDNR